MNYKENQVKYDKTNSLLSEALREYKEVEDTEKALSLEYKETVRLAIDSGDTSAMRVAEDKLEDILSALRKMKPRVEALREEANRVREKDEEQYRKEVIAKYQTALIYLEKGAMEKKVSALKGAYLDLLYKMGELGVIKSLIQKNIRNYDNYPNITLEIDRLNNLFRDSNSEAGKEVRESQRLISNFSEPRLLDPLYYYIKPRKIDSGTMTPEYYIDDMVERLKKEWK
jgi:hypothetical protein